MSRRPGAPWNGLNTALVKLFSSYLSGFSWQRNYPMSMLSHDTYWSLCTRWHTPTSQLRFPENKAVIPMKCPVLPRVDSTDHAAFVIKKELNEYEKQLSGCLFIFCLNLLMQQRAREIKDPVTGHTKTVFNNGWERVHETCAEYEARLDRQVDELITAIEHEKIPQEQPFCIFFQEAPIKPDQQKRILERFKRAFPNLTLAGATDSGVMTLTTGHYPRVDALAAKLEKLAVRCESFAINENHIISNIHTPHDNDPIAQKAKFKSILRPILESLTSGEITKPRCHDVIGDKNLFPAAVREAVEAVYEEIIKSRTQTPFSLEVLYESSPDGHVKDGGKKIVSVDGALSLRVTRADHHSSFTFHLVRNKLRYAVGLMATAMTYIGSAMLDASFVAADDMFAKPGSLSRLFVVASEGASAVSATTQEDKFWAAVFRAMR